MRVATVDVGTNTVLLLVAELRADGSVVAVEERATITRLGEGVDRTKRLSEEAIARTLACLRGYAQVIRQLAVQRVAMVGTSAMRDAAGAEDLRSQAVRLIGVDIRVLSGEDEARLAFRGALDGLGIADGQEVAVFDIGGGSTEVVLGRMEGGRPRIAFGASYDVGSVRLTERHIVNDPPSPQERDAIWKSARDTFANVPAAPPSSIPIGSAGTMTTLSAVAQRLPKYDGAKVHGHTIRLKDLRETVERIAALPVDARKALPGMEPKRADVVAAGGIIALALLEHWQAAAARISDRGVRWGLAHELIDAAVG
jgi:exopolyphosphatase/guanosine-5'-triphosphate,3'-diphosphate pyrophosphatase